MFSGTSLLSPQVMARFRFGSKVQTAFGGISTRSTILVEHGRSAWYASFSASFIGKSLETLSHFSDE